MIQNLHPIAFRIKSSTSLHMRRAAISALYDCIDSIFISQHHTQTQRRQESIPAFGTLEYALNIARIESNLTSDPTSEWQMLISETVQWAVSAVKIEPDIFCRTILYEIVKIAVNFFENN